MAQLTMKKLVPIAILAIAGGLAYMAWRRTASSAAGEGAATPASGFDALFQKAFGGAAPTVAPASSSTAADGSTQQ